MNFQEATKAMDTGSKVTRQSWGAAYAAYSDADQIYKRHSSPDDLVGAALFTVDAPTAGGARRQQIEQFNEDRQAKDWTIVTP